MTSGRSTLSILNDPLMMMLALMLLCSLPFIVPGGRAPDGPEITRSDVERLEREVASLEEERADALVELGRRQARTNKKAPSSPALLRRLRELKRRIRELQKKLDRDRGQADRLVRKLERRKASERAGAAKDRLDEIVILEKEIAELRSRKKELAQFTRTGLQIYDSKLARGKTATILEAASARLYVIKKPGYRITGDLVARNEHGPIHRVKCIRTSGAVGDTAADLASRASAFRTELARLKPKKNFLYAYVRASGYQAFLEARLIAQQQGFAVGWEPIGPETIEFYSGRGGSTRTARPGR